MATLGERLVTSDVVIKGRSKAAEVHAELAAGWPSGASWPPAPEVAADRIRVRRIRRIAAVSLFVAGAIDLLSSVTDPAARAPAPDRPVPARSPSSRRPGRSPPSPASA